MQVTRTLNPTITSSTILHAHITRSSLRHLTRYKPKIKAPASAGAFLYIFITKLKKSQQYILGNIKHGKLNNINENELIEKIKEDADSIKQEINLISTNLVQKKSKIEFDDIQKAIQTLQEKIEFIKIDLEKLNKELKSHEKNLTELNLQKETALQLEKAQKQKEELLQKEDEISILEKKLKSSQLASTLERPFYEKHNAIKDFDEINLQLKNQTEDFNKIFNSKANEYIEELNDNSLLKGSSNQEVYILDDSKSDKYRTYFNAESNKVQNFFTSDGVVSVGIHRPDF